MRQFLKQLVFGKECRPRTVRFGLGRGLRLITDPRHDVQRILGLLEPEIARYFRQFGSHCKSFCDVGASNGWYSLVVRKLNPTATIFACEPEPTRADEFSENGRLNGFQVDRQFQWISELIGMNHTRLDKLLSTAEEPVLIKIDVEGAELDVLESGRNILERKVTQLIVETHSLDLEKRCIEFLARLGYQSRIIGQAWWRFAVPETRPIPHNRWFVAARTASRSSK